MGWTPLTGGVACFIKLVQDNLIGMIGTYMDNTINNGDNSFEEESKLTERLPESYERNYDLFVIAGIEIKKIKDNFF